MSPFCYPDSRQIHVGSPGDNQTTPLYRYHLVISYQRGRFVLILIEGEVTLFPTKHDQNSIAYGNGSKETWKKLHKKVSNVICKGMSLSLIGNEKSRRFFFHLREKCPRVRGFATEGWLYSRACEGCNRNPREQSHAQGDTSV